MEYAGETVNTGPEAQAYAGFINGHLEGIGGGKTYAELGAVKTSAKAAVETARTDGTTAAEVAALQASSNGRPFSSFPAGKIVRRMGSPVLWTRCSSRVWRSSSRLTKSR
ncbi:hypothetical protein BH20ACT2_BH20ACT2_12970 [soil metagenome]